MKKMLKKIFSKGNIKWLALLIILIIAIIFFTIRKNNDVIIIKKHDLYQYFNGFRVDYKGRIQINKNEEEITKINFEGNSTELDSTPLYYSDENKALFPKNMAVIYPLEGKQYKVNYYSLIYKDSLEVCIKDKSKEKRLFDSIIYDGNDLYFITEDSKIIFGDKQFDVKALSYVIVNTFSKTVSIYDYSNQKYMEFEDVYDDVIISNDKYRVNASLDLMYYGDSSKLFIKDISKLKNLPRKD